MASSYCTKVTASGGRHGSICSEDGLLDLKLALPRVLGGKGDATNPEQLFAGGYAACFENALLLVSRAAGHRFADDDIDVVARIDLGRNETGGSVLAAALAVTMAGVRFAASRPTCAASTPRKRDYDVMSRLMTIMATVVLASSLYSVRAMPGIGDRVPLGYSGVHSRHHRLDVRERTTPHCYTPDEISKYPPWPPFCTLPSPKWGLTSLGKSVGRFDHERHTKAQWQPLAR
jgi:lipoyl-dependent peroxiredoxin